MTVTNARWLPRRRHHDQAKQITLPPTGAATMEAVAALEELIHVIDCVAPLEGDGACRRCWTIHARGCEQPLPHLVRFCPGNGYAQAMRRCREALAEPALDPWQPLRDAGYSELELRAAAGDR